MMDNAILKDALRLSSRREYLCKRAKPCPECHTIQVQLIDASICPAKWKCRHCNSPFQFEPVC